jgi:hypothetical protein
MVRFDRHSVFLPPSPRVRVESDVATQAGGSAGPLPADPLFLRFLRAPYPLESLSLCRDMSRAGGHRRSVESLIFS